MRTSQAGIDLIKRFEGFSATMYLDPVGLPTIGYGTLITAPDLEYLKTATITETQAEGLVRMELGGIEHTLSIVIPVTLNQNQFDSLVSFCYNLGTGAFRKSTLLKKIIINPADPAIRNEFAKWKYAGGKVLAGLVKRRKAEADLYFTDPAEDMT